VELPPCCDVRKRSSWVHCRRNQFPPGRRIEQQENSSAALGNNPGPIARERMAASTTFPGHSRRAALQPARARPDIRQAEAQLIAATPQIESRKQPYFPQISLTASGGFRVQRLTNHVYGQLGCGSEDSGTAHLRRGRRIRSAREASEARQQETLTDLPADHPAGLSWAISDALGRIPQGRELREKQEQLTFSAQARRPCMRCAIAAAAQTTWRCCERNNYLMRNWKTRSGASETSG